MVVAVPVLLIKIGPGANVETPETVSVVVRALVTVLIPVTSNVVARVLTTVPIPLTFRVVERALVIVPRPLTFMLVAFSWSTLNVEVVVTPTIKTFP